MPSLAGGKGGVRRSHHLRLRRPSPHLPPQSSILLLLELQLRAEGLVRSTLPCDLGPARERNHGLMPCETRPADPCRSFQTSNAHLRDRTSCLSPCTWPRKSCSSASATPGWATGCGLAAVGGWTGTGRAGPSSSSLEVSGAHIMSSPSKCTPTGAVAPSAWGPALGASGGTSMERCDDPGECVCCTAAAARAKDCCGPNEADASREPGHWIDASGVSHARCDAHAEHRMHRDQMRTPGG